MLSHLVLSLQSKRNMIVNVLKWDDSLGYTLQEELTALFHTGESRGGARAPPYVQAKLKPRGPPSFLVVYVGKYYMLAPTLNGPVTNPPFVPCDTTLD